MESTPETDKTTLFFLSTRAASICIICHSDIADSSNKRKLWKGNEKAKIFSELELYFRDTIRRNRDFQKEASFLKEVSRRTVY